MQILKKTNFNEMERPKYHLFYNIGTMLTNPLMIILLAVSTYYLIQILILKTEEISDFFSLLVMLITILFTILVNLFQDFKFHQVKKRLQNMFHTKVMVYQGDNRENTSHNDSQSA